MSIADLRDKSVADLQKELATTRQALAESYRLRAMNELTNTAAIRRQRRLIAQILTVLSEKALVEATPAETESKSKGKEA